MSYFCFFIYYTWRSYICTFKYNDFRIGVWYNLDLDEYFCDELIDENNINKFSRSVAAILVFIIWMGLVGLFLFLKYVDYREWDTMCKWICNICSLLPALWGLLSWFGLIPSKINIINLLSRGISGKITVWINK